MVKNEVYILFPSTNTESLSDESSIDKLQRIIPQLHAGGVPHRLLIMEDSGLPRIGVIRGRNILCREALKDPNCKYIFQTSNDMFNFPPGYLKTMVDYLETHPKVGAVDVQKIVDYGGGAGWGNYYMPDERMLPEDDKHTWQEYTTAFIGTGVSDDILPKQMWFAENDIRWKDYYIAFIIGGGSLIRADWMRKYGMWDQGYELGGHEEYDLGMRMFTTGYSVVNLTSVKVKHDLSSHGNHFEYPTLWDGTYHYKKWGEIVKRNPQSPECMAMLAQGKAKPNFEGSVW